MSSSNVKFTSNVYLFDPAKYPYDKHFVSKVTDSDSLNYLVNRGLTTGMGNALNRLQNDIVAGTRPCMLIKNDPCWGLLMSSEGTFFWGSKCRNYECPKLLGCRKGTEIEEDQQQVSELGLDDPDYGYQVPDNTTAVSEHVLGHHNIYDYRPVLFAIDTDEGIDTFSEDDGDAQDTLGDHSTDVFFEADVFDTADPPLLGTLLDSSGDSVGYDEAELNAGDNQDTLSGFIDARKIPLAEILQDFVISSQEAVIKGYPCENYLIDAGPGTGKTFTLMKKINYLISECEIEPQEIMILSFTRSAVAEIRDRFSHYASFGGSRGLRNVDVRTFHSLSWLMIKYANEFLTADGWRTIDLKRQNFESSIINAYRIVKKYPDIIGQVKYLIIDEIQDLTDEKAKFVVELIQACLKNGTGFSLLGDSCQAIYDYNSKEISSEVFYKMIYSLIRQRCTRVRFDENFRQNNNLIGKIKPFRDSILSNNSLCAQASIGVLSYNLPELYEDVSNLDNAKILKILDGGKVAFLCRNNGQTLRLSSYFKKRKIAHQLLGNESDDEYHEWIAVLIGLSTDQRIYRSSIEGVKNHRSFDKSTSIDTIWDAVERVTGRRHEVLVEDFVNALRGLKHDPIFTISRSGDLTISTVHRSKGREYDRVFINEDFYSECSDKEKDMTEYRTAYVAATRPKIDLFKFSLPSFDREKIRKDMKGRWYIKRGRCTHISIDSKNESDVHKVQFVYMDHDLRQRYISNSVCNGDPIILQREINHTISRYRICHEKNDLITVLGYMAPSFTDAVRYHTKPKSDVELPAQIDDLYVDAVCTYIDREGQFGYVDTFKEIREYSPYGIWKWVSFSGMGHLIYDVY